MTRDLVGCSHLLGVCDHDFLDVRRDHRSDRGCVAGRFDDDHVLLRKLLCESLEKGPAHVNAPQSFELAVVPGHRLGEGAVDIQTNDPHVCCSVSVRSKRKLAGNTTSTDPRSRRIRESRKGRPCNELGLSAHCLSAACPHLRAPGAPCPGWAHHIASFPFGNSRTTRRRRISYRIMASSSASTRRCSMSSIASPFARRSTARSPISRSILIAGSKVTMRKGRTKDDGASAKRRSRRSLTRRRLRRRK